MKQIARVVVVCLLALALTNISYAQDGAAKAEFDCLVMAQSSSGVPTHTGPSHMPSFHHVWTPEIEYGYFESHGTKLLYEVEGTGSEVVIVVHGGAGLPHEYFHPMLSNLSKYARLVYFDRRADMMSGKWRGEMASLDEMADDVDALRRKLGMNRVTILGHSFGASIALNYALRYPTNVKRLIVVSAGPEIENPAEAEKRIVAKLSASELAKYHANEGGTGGANPCERVRSRYSVLYPHYFHKLAPYEFERGVYTAYFDSLSKRMALAGNSKGFDVRSRLGDLKVPVLVVAGRHDLVTPLAQASELASGLPLSRLVVMEHSGHFPFFEENYLFTEWVKQFMAGTNSMSDELKTVTAASSASGRR